MEEDIKILEEFTESSCCLASQEEIIECVKNLIKGYRELEEENEELKRLANNKQWISPCYVAHNYIPKSKIKEKIEELNTIKDNKEFGLSYGDLLNFVDDLQELMEDK